MSNAWEEGTDKRITELEAWKLEHLEKLHGLLQTWGENQNEEIAELKENLDAFVKDTGKAFFNAGTEIAKLEKKFDDEKFIHITSTKLNSAEIAELKEDIKNFKEYQELLQDADAPHMMVIPYLKKQINELKDRISIMDVGMAQLEQKIARRCKF